jgi:O-antigen/teichoic acid export membrane protein
VNTQETAAVMCPEPPPGVDPNSAGQPSKCATDQASKTRIGVVQRAWNSGASRLQGMLGGDGLKARIFRGGAWLGVGSISEQSARFIRNMILARLIAPSAFGTMAIVMSASALLQAFTELGVREALIQNPNGSKREYINAAWWLAFGRAVAIYAALFAFAPWVAKFYGDVQLTSLLRVATLGLLIEGAMSTRAYVAMKEMRFSRWAAITHGGGIIGVVTTVILGFVLRDVWALVIGTCAESVARCVMSYVICPAIPSINLDRAALRSLLNFSKGLFGLAPLVIIYMRMDIFVLGKMIPTSELGYYSLGVAVAQVPAGFVCNLLGQLFMPALAHVQGDQARTRRIVLQVTGAIMLIAVPLIFFAYFCGGSLLSLVYGHRYAVAAAPLLLAACCALVQFLNNQITTAFYAAGAPQLHRLCVVIMAVLMIFLTYPLARLFGPTGGQLAALISITAGFLIQLNRARHLIGVRVAQYGKLLLQALTVSAVVIAMCLAVRAVGFLSRPALMVASGLLACLLAYLIASWRLIRNGGFAQEYS